MPRKSKDQRSAEKTSRIATRGAKRAAGREVRKERRTERLAARKGITTEQAGKLQENRRTRFKEFAAGGTENITTGRLRFSDPEPSADKAASTSNATSPAASASTAAADAFSGSSAAAADRLGMGQDSMLGRGGTLYNQGGAGKTASVEVGEHGLGDIGLSDEKFSSFDRKTKGAAGYN